MIVVTPLLCDMSLLSSSKIVSRALPTRNITNAGPCLAGSKSVNFAHNFTRHTQSEYFFD